MDKSILNSDYLQTAEAIATSSGPDAAARFLAPYRREVCEKLADAPAHIGDLLRISSQQMHYLCQAGMPDKSAGIAEWFLHTLHHLEEDIPAVDFVHLKRVLRESFSHFFMRYARALRDLDRIEDMRLSVRTALDLTQDLPLAMVSMVHLYVPLQMRDTLEGEPACEWLLKRYAECLAALDFSGQHQTPFRAALDEYQYGLRGAPEFEASKAALANLALAHPEDEAIATLVSLQGLSATKCQPKS